MPTPLLTILPRLYQLSTSRGYALWCACACLITCSLAIRKADNDLFARIATGRLIVRDGAIPTADIFSFSPTKELWIDHEWLSAVLFYLTSTVGGDAALFLLTIGCGCLTLALLAGAQRELAPQSTLPQLFLFGAVFPCSFIWNSIIRCHVFSFLFFSYLLVVVARYRRAPSLLLAASVPVTMVIWVNCHGSFIVGYGLLLASSIALLWEGAQRAWLFARAVGVSLLAVCATPYGSDYLPFIWQAVSMSRPAIGEWSSPKVWSAAHIIFVLALACTAAVLISRKRCAIRLEGQLFLLAASCAALTHQRLIPFFLFAVCIFLPPALPQSCSRISSRWVRARLKALNGAALTVMCTTGVVGFFSVGYCIIIIQKRFTLDRSEYPVETVRWMRQHKLAGNVLVPFNQGSYVLMKGYPDFRVSIDGRYEEVYSQETFERALAAISPHSPNFAAAFAALAPDFVILCRSTLPLSAASLFPGMWKPLFIQQNNECGVFGDPKSITHVDEVPNEEPAWHLYF